MRKTGLFDLEKHFAFYGAYHSNLINIVVHMIFVWPIFFTALLILYFTPSILTVDLSLSERHVVLAFNVGFLLTLVYSLFYFFLDGKAGSLAALLCFACWVGSSFLGGYFRVFGYLEGGLGFLDRNLIWVLLSFEKVVFVAQVVCWTGQFIGHGVFERRAPALLDNLVQAFLMAPFFVLLEALQSFFGYEPYPGFHDVVQARVDAEITEWKESKQRLVS